MEVQQTQTTVQTFSRPLAYRHISTAVKEAVRYIDDRRKHLIEPLKTRWPKFNKMCNGGIEPGSVYTIAGISASGKSAFVNALETDLIVMNPKKDVVILSFSFEMLSSRQVGRKLSNRLRQTTSTLYSSEFDVSDNLYNNIVNAAKEIAEFPIYYVDTPMGVNGIAETISHFQNTIAKNKWLVIMMDHTALVDGDDERKTIANLQKVFIEAKKISKTSIIQISQMNRSIESSDRILNPSSHYPMRSDLFASDSVYQGSDVVAVIHRPETIGITAYGPKRLPVKDKVYLHFLKQREGTIGILVFENELKHNTLTETTISSDQQQ